MSNNKSAQTVAVANFPLHLHNYVLQVEMCENLSNSFRGDVSYFQASHHNCDRLQPDKRLSLSLSSKWKSLLLPQKPGSVTGDSKALLGWFLRFANEWVVTGVWSTSSRDTRGLPATANANRLYKYPSVLDILASKSLFPSARSEGVKSKVWLICDMLTWLGTLPLSDLWGALPIF